MEQLNYIPIPHLAGMTKDGKTTWDVDGMVFSLLDIAPNQLKFNSETNFGFNTMSSKGKAKIQDVLRGRASHIRSGEYDKIEPVEKSKFRPYSNVTLNIAA